MNSDLDAALGRLALEPTHPGLLSIEDEVLARIHAVPETTGGLGLMAVAAIGAIALGVVGAGPSAASASAAPISFDAGSALAPSTLLMGRS